MAISCLNLSRSWPLKKDIDIWHHKTTMTSTKTCYAMYPCLCLAWLSVRSQIKEVNSWNQFHCIKRWVMALFQGDQGQFLIVFLWFNLPWCALKDTDGVRSSNDPVQRKQKCTHYAAIENSMVIVKLVGWWCLLDGLFQLSATERVCI